MVWQNIYSIVLQIKWWIRLIKCIFGTLKKLLCVCVFLLKYVCCFFSKINIITFYAIQIVRIESVNKTERSIPQELRCRQNLCGYLAHNITHIYRIYVCAKLHDYTWWTRKLTERVKNGVRYLRFYAAIKVLRIQYMVTIIIILIFNQNFD